MNRFASSRVAAISAAMASGSVLLSGCNTVVATPSAGLPAAGPEVITIEHTSLRSRTSVYESALKACRKRGHDQAIFQTQANEEQNRPPATGPQLSTFACR